MVDLYRAPAEDLLKLAIALPERGEDDQRYVGQDPVLVWSRMHKLTFPLPPLFQQSCSSLSTRSGQVSTRLGLAT